MKNEQANRERRCLVCGTPDAALYRLRDGRDWRCCDKCAQTTEATAQLNGAMERDPLPCEMLFVILKLETDGFNGLLGTENTMGAAVSGNNAYIACYSEKPSERRSKWREMTDPTVVQDLWVRKYPDTDGTGRRIPWSEVGQDHPHNLKVGQCTLRAFALCGEYAEYIIERVA